ncbi:hypothetical protein WA556_006500, partial [Blastocystis sp. ATCC 50177/Nand II]
SDNTDSFHPGALYKADKSIPISLGSSAPSLLQSKDITEYIQKELPNHSIDREAIRLLKMYVNTCVEYCVLKTVSEENDPYDDCCYVNGAAIHRNSKELLKTIDMDKEAEREEPKQPVHPLLQNRDSPHVNPLLRL